METLDFILNILIVVLGVAFVIFIHELGHFSVAKWLNMKVEAFSIGFGKVIWSFQRGETEYRLSLVPLGGYVKLAGETPDESSGDERDFSNRPASHRALVLIAGVVMNAVSAVFLLFGAYLIGVKEVWPEVGHVMPASVAAEAGLQKGDVIKQVNGVAIYDFTEVVQEAALSGGEPITLKWDRGGQSFSETITPRYDEDRGLYTIGIMPRPLPIVKELHPSGAEAGLKIWDTVTDIHIQNEWRSVDYFDEIAGLLSDYQKDHLKIRAKRKNGEVFEASLQSTPMLGFSYKAPSSTPEDWFRFKSAEEKSQEQFLIVDQVVPGFPAAEIGIQANDVIESAAVAGKTTRLRNLKDMQEFLKKHRNDEITLNWHSSEGMKSASFFPKKSWSLGFVPMNNFQLTKISLSQPGVLVSRSFRKARNDLLNVLKSLKSFVSGHVAAKNLNGPITIARVSMLFVELGLGSFFAFLAMISFNLAILNILPIPMLDGGHLLLVGIEKLIGRPLSEKVQITLQYVGLILIGSLMLLVFYNDIFHAQW